MVVDERMFWCDACQTVTDQIVELIQGRAYWTCIEDVDHIIEPVTPFSV